MAVLKTLQAEGSGRWKIRRLQEVLHWLEPASTTELAAELRAAGVLAYDPVSGIYRLTTEAHVVTAILDPLTVPGLDPRRLATAFYGRYGVRPLPGSPGRLVIPMSTVAEALELREARVMYLHRRF